MNWLDKTLHYKSAGQEPIIALAPMADLTDSPFCRVCREVAATPPAPSWKEGDHQPFVIFREMVSAEAIVRGNKKTLKMCEFEEIEKPIVLQLFGSKPEVIVKAAEILVNGGLLRRSAPRNDIAGIDINMGCPVPKIAGKGLSGAALMKDHNRAVEIVRALKQANLGLSISVKTRLGWSNKADILEFAPKLEQAGADAITIHGRTKTQGYSGSADWGMIGQAVKSVSIPVIANGDINSAEDIHKCLEITHAAGVMIGRGALGNPWIFRSVIASSAQAERSNPNVLGNTRGKGIASSPTAPRNDIKRVVLRHAELHLEHYGEEFGLKTFRKHLLHYFKGLSNVKELRMQLVKINTLEELKEILKKLRN